jgi:uncharacterized protein
MRFLGASIFALLLCFTHSVWAQDEDIARKPVPKYYGLVNDFADFLDAGAEQQLEQKLRKYEDSTSTQIVIVIEKSLEGRAQFDRSLDFARQWKIGNAENNNGVLIYMATDEKKISIRNSNEVMGKITGAESDEVIRNIMAPELRAGNRGAAFDKATDAIIQMLAGQFKAGKKKKVDTVSGWMFFLAIFIIIIIISAINNRNGNGRGYRGGGVYWFPTGGFGGNSWGGESSGGGGWGGMGGGGGFDGGGADGGW